MRTSEVSLKINRAACKSLIIITATFFVGSCKTTPPKTAPCPRQLRAVFDVGSGTTKLNLSEIEICQDKIQLVRTIDDQNTKPIALAQGLDDKGYLSEATLKALAVALADLKAKALSLAQQQAPDFKVIYFGGVATEAVRSAKNSQSVMDIANNLGIPLVAIDQTMEARLGFEAANVSVGSPPNCDASEPVVWDIGGGSQQLAHKNGTVLKMQNSKWGAESFKEAWLQKRRCLENDKNCTSSASPNPVGRASFAKLIRFSQDKAKELKLAHPNNPSMGHRCVIGIGGVHNSALAKKLKQVWHQIQTCACAKSPTCQPSEGRSFSQTDLRCLGEFLANQSDHGTDIRGPYASTAVTSIGLVLGHMQQMGIDQVHVRAVNLTHAVVVAKESAKIVFWAQDL